MYPTLSPAFFEPTGCSSVDLLPSLFPRFRAPQLNRYALSRSLVGTCRTWLGRAPSLPVTLQEEMNSPSSISVWIVSLLSAWLGPFVLHNGDLSRFMSHTAFSTPLLAFPFPFLVSEMFMDHLVSSVPYRTVKSYLWAVRSHIEFCNGDPLFATPCSEYELPF